MIVSMLLAIRAQAATIHYIGDGRNAPKINVTISRNNGASWEHKEVRSAQTYTIPQDVTNLLINNAPYEASKTYKLKGAMFSNFFDWYIFS